MVDASSTLLSRSFRAIRWSYSGVAANVALQAAASIFFARTLGPRLIGVFAYGLLIFPLFRFLCEFGLGSALVDRPELTERDIQAALTRSALLAVLTAAAWLVFIGPMAAAAKQNSYRDALACFALVLLTFPVQTLCTAVLTKQLEQKYLQISALVAYAVGYLLIGGFVAMLGGGVWAPILGFVAQNLIATAILLVHTRIRIRLSLTTADAASLWKFGSRATAINLSNWLTSSLDNMSVAWFFGTKTLGIYSTAYGLLRTPADKIVTTLQNVLFPASVLSRNDKQRLTKGCIASVDAVFIVTAPSFVAVAVLAQTVTDALYGAAWRDVAMILPPFALAMIFHCISVVASALLWGSGGIGRDMRLQWTVAAVFLIVVVVAAQFSYMAVAWTTLPIAAMRAGWGLRALAITVGYPFRRVFRAFAAGGTLVIIITPSLAMIDHWLLQKSVPALERLIVEASTGALTWLVFVLRLSAGTMTPELRGGLQLLGLTFRSKTRNHA